VDLSDIIFAADDVVELNATGQATVSVSGTPPDDTNRSLWQNNLVAIRAKRFVNWKRAHDDSVVSMVIDE
jgi:hypothetical protein